MVRLFMNGFEQIRGKGSVHEMMGAAILSSCARNLSSETASSCNQRGRLATVRIWLYECYDGARQFLI